MTEPPNARAATMELQEALSLVPDVDARARLIHELERVAARYRERDEAARKLQEQFDAQVAGVRCMGMTEERKSGSMGES